MNNLPHEGSVEVSAGEVNIRGFVETQTIPECHHTHRNTTQTYSHEQHIPQLETEIKITKLLESLYVTYINPKSRKAQKKTPSRKSEMKLGMD